MQEDEHQDIFNDQIKSIEYEDTSSKLTYKRFIKNIESKRPLDYQTK